MGLNIKGITIPALLIKFDESLSFEDNLKELEEKLNSAFFKSSVSIVDAGNFELSEEQKKILEETLKKHNSEILSYKFSDERKKKKNLSKLTRNLKIINKTVRSGQKIEYEGDILVLGDVNPDAYIIASGNIIVMGALRGIAHAGANGDENAQIIALKLIPQQLRIAGYYTRSPDEDTNNEPNYPEKAYIENNRIYIEKI